MAEHRHDPGGDQLVCGRDGLLALAIVVGRDQLDLLAEHAAPGVEIGDRKLGAFLRSTPRPGVGAGHRRREADPDFGACGRSARGHPQNDG